MPHRKRQRNTPQRRAVLEELQRVTSHPTAVELCEIVRQRLPKISLGTVYRNLELLAEMGVIQKLELGGSEARFDGNTERHEHIRCIECGRVDDLRGVPMQKPDLAADSFRGYKVVDYRVQFLGICQECLKKRTQRET